MEAKKKFDCLELKDRLQAEVTREIEEIGERAYFSRLHQWLDASDDPLAVWWRRVADAQKSGAER